MQVYVEVYLIMLDEIQNGLVVSAQAQAPIRQEGEDAQAAEVATIAAHVEEAHNRVTNNAKVKLLLNCALSPSEFIRISSYQLLLTFGGTNRVKETKMKIILGNCELFKMKANETVS